MTSRRPEKRVFGQLSRLPSGRFRARFTGPDLKRHPPVHLRGPGGCRGLAGRTGTGHQPRGVAADNPPAERPAILPAFGHRQPSEISKADVTAWYRSMNATPTQQANAYEACTCLSPWKAGCFVPPGVHCPADHHAPQTGPAREAFGPHHRRAAGRPSTMPACRWVRAPQVRASAVQGRRKSGSAGYRHTPPNPTGQTQGAIPCPNRSTPSAGRTTRSESQPALPGPAPADFSSAWSP